MRLSTKTITLSLSLAFGLLLMLTIAATAVTLTGSFAIFYLLSDTHDRHDEAGEALQRLRSDLYLAGILKRDFLLNRDPDEANAYKTQLAAIQASTERNLTTIERVLGAQQRETVRQLRAEVTRYMRPLKEALDWDPVLAPSLRSYLLRAQLQQRSAAEHIAEEIETLNAESLTAQKQQIEKAEGQFRHMLLSISLASILIGLAVAVFTVLYTRRLERRSDEVQTELKRLSQHVVRAQEIERRNISRELHDEVGQMLTGLRMELANLDVPSLKQNTADYQRLQEAKQLTERTLQCVRNISMLLRPSMLDDLGLSPALQWQGKEFSRRSGIPINVDIQGDADSVPDEVRTCVYRIVQEALTNVVRHADARRISVVVKREGERIRVQIEDDGKGFDPTRTRRAPGIGLIGLKERVAELSGVTDIQSVPGKGTQVFVDLPVRAEEVAC